VDRKTEVFFHTMTEERLQQRMNVVRPNGRTTDDTIGDVLYQIPIEIIHHYGELLAELWKMNAEIPYYTYLKFRRESSQKRPQAIDIRCENSS
jgi:uncharacterized damage-inducible protein DinB